jgi:hypothetical protein
MSAEDEAKKFQGDADLEKVSIQNKPAYLDIMQIHMDGNLLILTGIISRGGKTKDIIWVYKRVKG